MHKILVYGDLVSDMVMRVDRLPVEANRVQNIHAIGIEPGGAGNSLIVAARLGAHAIALGTIGEDNPGQQVFDALRDEGVDTDAVQRGAGSVNMTVLVMIDAVGEHVFLVHRGHGQMLQIGDTERALISAADAYLVPGYSLHEPRVGPVAIDALNIAQAAKVPVFSDLGPIVGDPSLREAALAVNAASRMAVLTEDEALTFTGAADASSAARWLQSHGAREVVLKRGSAGCLCFADGEAEPVSVDGIAVDARDTSGAGDAFVAGFIVEWLKHHDLVRAARFANAVGAAKVRKVGTGRQMPTRAEIEELLR
jgi:sugar/nucleoside kinase (ribokinase family)